MASQLPQVPLLSSSASLKEINDAVLFILDYLERLRREAERSDDTVQASADEASTTAGEKVSKAGDTMTGLLTLSGDPSSALHAATKQYVDTAAAPIPYTLLRDEQTANTPGGTSVIGYQTRVLNTSVVDEIGVSLGNPTANEFTLPAGTYRVRTHAPGHRCSRHRIRLQNVTDTATTLLGPGMYADATGTVTNRALLEGVFTIAATKTFRLEHYQQVAIASNGLGVEVNSGETEVYAVVEIWKLS